VIPLTRPDGSTLLVNPDRIETVEETPDTVITLADGKKLLVREAAVVVANRFRSYKRSLRSDTRFGGRRRSDPPMDDDAGAYGNPNRVLMRAPHSDDGGAQP
jgi:flagellar protein FlbD